MTDHHRTLPGKVSALLSLMWRWSLLVTVPIGCLFVIWTARTGERYSQLGVRFETLNNYMSLRRVGSYEARNVVRDLQLALRPREFDRPNKLRTMQVFLAEASERALDERLPHSGRDYVPASFLYPGGEIHKVKLRYRGDHFWHWGARKKSLRVKTKKSKLFERTRALNISVPKTGDMIAEFLSNELALDFGLIGPKSEIVQLAVNGENRGIHLFVEQLEEMVLRTNGRMPGDLYAADIVKRNAYHGVPTQVFSNPGLWEKVAINNHFPDGEDRNLRRLIQVVSAEPSAQRTRDLRELVDIEAFARFQVFRAVCQTFHYDNAHNQRLYYDPWRNVFVPVVWDPVGWHHHSVPQGGRRAKPDVVTSPLDVALYQDPEFLAMRQRVLEEWFLGGGLERLLDATDSCIERVDPSLDRDPGLCLSLRALSPDDVREAQAKLSAVMEKIGQNLKEDFLAPGSLAYTASAAVPRGVRVEVDGRRALVGLELVLAQPVVETPGARVSILTAEGVQTIDLSAEVSSEGNTVHLSVPLAPQFVVERTDAKKVKDHYAVTIAPATYDVTLTGGGTGENRIEHISGIHADGSRRSAKAVDSITRLEMVNTFDPGSAAPRLEPLLLSGEHVFEGLRTIERDVIVEPGTTLRMGPGASLIIEGRVTARGTEGDPIRVLPMSEGQDPWGTVAIRGERARGSSFSWVEMSSGSGHKEVRAEYSAMFSIHDAHEVVVEDCKFSDSQVVDDMVHAVYSTVTFRRCTFLRSLMDALDIDISEALVEDCRFVESGNDALDLMTSTVAVQGTQLIQSGDKGVSVGEDTEAFLYRCSMLSCGIGVQIKDRSKAVIVQCDVRDCKQGVDAYKKNWRYDSGGWGYLYASLIANNDVQLSADKHSRLMVHDSYLSPWVEPSKRLVMDEACDDRTPSIRRASELFRFPDEAADSPELFEGLWSQVEGRQRGVSAVR